MSPKERDEPLEDWPALLAQQARSNAGLFYSLAYKVLRNRTAAEDACQKALLSAWIRRDDIKDRSRIKGWLATAVVNESLATLRRQKVEQQALKLVAVGVSGVVPGGASGGAATGSAGDLREATLLALSNLSENERAAVTLRVMHEHSGSEVAATLGISQGQVSKLLYRGMEELRESLAQWKDSRR